MTSDIHISHFKYNNWSCQWWLSTVQHDLFGSLGKVLALGSHLTRRPAARVRLSFIQKRHVPLAAFPCHRDIEPEGEGQGCLLASMSLLFSRQHARRLAPSFRVPAKATTSATSAQTLRAARTEFRPWSRGAHTANHSLVDPGVLIEEEKLRDYKADHYYPVEIGDISQGRYNIVGKLGYGTTSTVWLCRDLRREQGYVALKVYTNASRVHRELPIYEHINSLPSQHAGRECIRSLLDSFEIDGPHGKHTCLVHEALGMNMEELRELVPGRMFGADLIRQSLRDILRGIHFLHEDARVVHTGQL